MLLLFFWKNTTPSYQWWFNFIVHITVNALVSGAGCLRFKFQAGQSAHSVACSLPPLRYFFNGAVLPNHNYAKIGPANSLHASAFYSEYNERFNLHFSMLRAPSRTVTYLRAPLFFSKEVWNEI